MPPREAPNIDDLYAVPLDAYVAERDRIATELATAGDKDGAKAVKALRKPSVTAWTLNQLARSDRALLSELFATGEQMRQALEAGDQAGAREAQAARRSRLKRAGERAGEILEGAGHASSPQIERIRSILLQASTDEEVAGEVLGGRLTREPEGDALPDAFGGAFIATEEEREVRGPGDRRVAKLEARVDELRGEADEAAARAARLARDAESARLGAEAAEQNAEAAQRAAERAAKHLEDAKARLEEARK